MKSRKFGPTGRSVPVIGQGTWELPTSADAIKKAQSAMVAGVERGMTHIDTAEMYGTGQSEEILSKVIAGFPRDNLFLVSKVLPENATFKGTINACEASLRRMKIDYLDCYLLHWRGSHPLEGTMQALTKLVDDGKIRALGVSNFDWDDIEEALTYVGKHPIACNQVLYHLHERGIERKVIPLCEKNSIAVVAYTPFGQRQVPGPRTTGGAVLSRVAEKHGVTVRQVILSFLVRLDCLFTIPKAAKLEHTLENAGAGDVVLDAADIADIDAAFPAPQKDTPLAML